MIDEDYMRLALRLAERGRLTARPNPMVGAVAVRDGRILGRGWHPAPGQPHAEVFALRSIDDGRGLTVYVTLEPCSHHGRTPPCADFLAERHVARLVCAMEDPDARVRGRGIGRLQAAGARVTVGVLGEEAARLNAAYVKHRTTGLPFVTLKLAQTLDGAIATASGDSKWITGEAARRRAHAMRAEAQAVIVGRATVAADDPALSVRHVKGADPMKIVLDGGLNTPPGARVFEGAPLVLAAREGVDAARLATAEKAGATVWTLPAENGRPGLGPLLRRLGERDVIHVLVEGGARVAASFLSGGWVDRVAVFVAPKVAGGGRGAVADLGIRKIADSIRLANAVTEHLGDDLLVTADVVKRGGGSANRRIGESTK